jgi:hypothetical protein
MYPGSTGITWSTTIVPLNEPNAILILNDDPHNRLLALDDAVPKVKVIRLTLVLSYDTQLARSQAPFSQIPGDM